MTGKTAMVIPGYSAKLAIANPTNRAVSIILTLDSGAQALAIPARSQLLVTVTGKALVIESGDAYYPNLILSDPKGYSVISPRENANLGSDIRVSVR
jgi:hypothetical protein